MTIELISRRTYNILMGIQKKYEKLTFQNVGYQYLNKTKFTEQDHKAFKLVQKILARHITGFKEFNHFRLTRKTEEVEVRFQYDWTADDEDDSIPFRGVGYLKLTTLYNGFYPIKLSDQTDVKEEDLISVHINKMRSKDHFWNWSSDNKDWIRGEEISQKLKDAYNNPALKTSYK